MSDGCCGPAAIEIEQFLAPAQADALPVVVIGAGPVGLAAAAHLAERGLDFLVLEAGDRPAPRSRQWGHVRVFTPWRYNIDAAARRLLEAAGWTAPDPDWLPTGAELVADYLAPAGRAARARAAPALRRAGRGDQPARPTTGSAPPAASTAPFLVRLADGEELLARAVIDASGTWRTPNVLGAVRPARPRRDRRRGVRRARAARRARRRPGPLRRPAHPRRRRRPLRRQHPARPGRAGRRGTGHRGHLGDPRRRRRPAPTAAATPTRCPPAARSAPGCARTSTPAGSRLLTGFSVHAVTADRRRVRWSAATADGAEQSVTADRIVAATGFRPDHSIAAELRLDLDPILGSTRALAPLIDPNQHSCGTVPAARRRRARPPRARLLRRRRRSATAAPRRSCMATGYEQARSVVAALAGDWDAARDVQLDLPETGVCSTDLAEAQEQRVGLATGISGGLLATPLPLVTVASDGGGCCG